jgi:hypothetical protein
VLKTGGLLFIEATSLHHGFRYRLWFRAMDVLHIFRNPARLGPGDRLMRAARQMRGPASELPRSHWFRPREIGEEAREGELEVVQATTTKEIVENPAANATTYRGQGRLVYVLRVERSRNGDAAS